jgi:hypothetical protein
LCFFLGIPLSSIRLKSHTSGRTTFQGADQKRPFDDIFNYLGERVARAQVNKGIYATIMTDPDVFFAYNNEINGIHRL